LRLLITTVRVCVEGVCSADSFNEGGQTRQVDRGQHLALVCAPSRQDVPDEQGLRGGVVVEDDSPVAYTESKMLAAGESSDVERAVVGLKSIERAEYACAYWWVEAA
jgi:hypothetical protein